MPEWRRWCDERLKRGRRVRAQPRRVLRWHHKPRRKTTRSCARNCRKLPRISTVASRASWSNHAQRPLKAVWHCNEQTKRRSMRPKRRIERLPRLQGPLRNRMPTLPRQRRPVASSLLRRPPRRSAAACYRPSPLALLPLPQLLLPRSHPRWPLCATMLCLRYLGLGQARRRRPRPFTPASPLPPCAKAVRTSIGRTRRPSRSNNSSQHRCRHPRPNLPLRRPRAATAPLQHQQRPHR